MIEMNILTHDEAKRLSQSSTDPLEVIRNVEVAVVVKLAGMQNALKDEIRLVWKPKCDALRQQLEVESKAAAHWMEEANMEHNKNVRLSQQLEAAVEELRADLAQALCDDCENGVKWLNKQAVEKFKRDFPQLVAVMHDE